MGLSGLCDARGVDHEAAFNKLGWVTRRTGNHIILTSPNVKGVTLSIPNHPHVKRALLKGLIRKAGLTDELYMAAFKSL
jgi:predicted RNA binding protein YcfA (HicA-like mRNA interferase family)